MTGKTLEQSYLAFDLAAVEAERSTVGNEYHQFLDTATLRVGVYDLPVGSTDHQEPHEIDEVYHVLRGRAILRVDATDVPVRAGSVVFVKAGAPHRFYCIEEDLAVLVFFSTADPTAGNGRSGLGDGPC